MRTLIFVTVVAGLVSLWAGLAAAQQPPAAQPGVENTSPTGPEEGGPGAPPAAGQPGEGAGKPAPGGGRQNRPPGPFGSWRFLLLLGGLVLVYIWMLSRSRKKEQQRRQAMLKGLKKGDKVTTRGGIIGTVIEVRGDELTIKVDESSNTRMRFANWAVLAVGEGTKGKDAQEAQGQSESK